MHGFYFSVCVLEEEKTLSSRHELITFNSISIEYEHGEAIKPQ